MLLSAGIFADVKSVDRFRATYPRLILMQWTAPLQQHLNVPSRDSDGRLANALLAFSECPLLAINGH